MGDDNIFNFVLPYVLHRASLTNSLCSVVRMALPLQFHYCLYGRTIQGLEWLAWTQQTECNVDVIGDGYEFLKHPGSGYMHAARNGECGANEVC